MDEVHIFARDNLKISSGASKQYYDTKTMGTRYEDGTGVWLYNPQRRKGRSPKLSRNWDGPYLVVKQLNDVVVRIKKSRKAKPKVVHINRLKPYTGEQSLDWFVDASLMGNIESGGKTSKDRDNRDNSSDKTVRPLRRGERCRKEPQRYTP